MSSDANGSMAVYDAEGRFVGLCVTTVETMHKEFRDLALTKEMPLETALRPRHVEPCRRDRHVSGEGLRQRGLGRGPDNHG